MSRLATVVPSFSPTVSPARGWKVPRYSMDDHRKARSSARAISPHDGCSDAGDNFLLAPCGPRIPMALALLDHYRGALPTVKGASTDHASLVNASRRGLPPTVFCACLAYILQQNPLSFCFAVWSYFVKNKTTIFPTKPDPTPATPRQDGIERTSRNKSSESRQGVRTLKRRPLTCELTRAM